MSFKFQINNDVTFNHNEKLLQKADQYKPQIYRTEVDAKKLVSIIEDTTKLEKVGVKVVENADKLSQQQMARNDSVILDFGQHCVGKFSIHIEHVGSPMDAPLSFKIKFAEMPNELVHNSNEYNGWLSKSWIQEETIHLDRLPVNFNLPRRYSFRYVQITIIDTSPKWHVKFSNAKAIVQSSADSTIVSPLNTNDSKLKAIYNVGITTLHDCMQDVFEDGPKRDRRLWLGDLRLQALTNYATFNNTSLVKRCLYLFGAMTSTDNRISANVFTDQEYVPDDTFMYDYSLFFISVLDDLERHEFDQTVLDDLYPIAKHQWQYMLPFINTEGRVIPDENYTVFVDWSNEFDKTTSAQAITIYALKQLIHLAKLVNDPSLTEYKTTLTLLENYAKTKLYDAKQKLFVSGGNKELNISSQVWMVLAHVMNDDTNQQIMINAIKKLFPVKGIATPYMYHHITQALFEANLKDEAIKLMKNYWGKMIDLGADTYWEAFDPDNPNYSPYGSPIVNSYCHAWSCTPVYLLQKYLN
ncbi:alpha-rhamnosidase [Liquorilactobacillus ghanensis]|uniref:alpha-L-rhamnosidase-related protein n=1 Tax=Liquorilactobacillus ghanensis TaxID=399370 RepID=UPI0039E7E6E6